MPKRHRSETPETESEPEDVNDCRVVFRIQSRDDFERRPISDYLLSEMSEKMIRIDVGKEPYIKSWTLHEQLLCEHSDYFRACFQGGFPESHSKHLILPDEDPHAFIHFVEWLYTGHFRERQDGDPSRMFEDMIWCMLYVLADMFLMAQLAEESLKQLRFYLLSPPHLLDLEVVTYVYKNTMEESPLRQFVIGDFKRFYFQSFIAEFENEEENYTLPHHDFMREITMVTRRHISGPDCDIRDCQIHPDYKNGKKRRRCKTWEAAAKWT